MSGGYQATQSAHAALQFSVAFPDLTRKWHDESNYLVVLACADEAELLSLAERAAERMLCYTVFREPDIGNEITAIVIEPGDETSRLLSNLPLALREPAMT